MAQSNIVYDDITGPFKRAYEAEQKFMGKVPSPGKKVDTSWHDEMVKEANESFRKQAQKSSANPKLGQKKKSKRKTAAKKSAAKKRQ